MAETKSPDDANNLPKLVPSAKFSKKSFCGDIDGDEVGESVCPEVGLEVGPTVGETVSEVGEGVGPGVGPGVGMEAGPIVPEKVGEIEIVTEAAAVGPAVGEVEIIGKTVAVGPAVTSTQTPATYSVPIGHSTQDWLNVGVLTDKLAQNVN